MRDLEGDRVDDDDDDDDAGLMGLRFRALGGGAVNNVVKPGRGGRRAMGPPSATLRKSGPDEVARAIKPLECVIFDCDGVIWKGDSLIDGVPAVLEMLRKAGKKSQPRVLEPYP